MKAITALAAWFDPIPPEHRALAAAFDAEAQAYSWERMYVPMGIMGAINMTLFSVMDWLVYPQHLATLLMLRFFGMILPDLLVALIARYGRRRTNPHPIGLGLQCVLTLADCGMLVVVDDWTSPYWLLLLVTLIYANTAPWSTAWALASTGVVTFAYLLGTWRFGNWAQDLGTLVFYNLSMFSAAFLGVLAIHRPLLHLRWQNFLRRHQLAEAQVEIQTAHQTLQQYTAELEANNAELDAFAHTVAHDLKNPIAVLIGFSTLLEACFHKMPPEKVRDNLQRITLTSYKLTRIVDELLLLASVRKMAQVQTGPLDMRAIVAEAQERLADMIAKTQADIVAPETWPAAVGYAPWVEEVWTNYLSNALKYGGTPPRVEFGYSILEAGSSKLEAGDQPSASSNQHPVTSIQFWVQDNGPGLTTEQQSQLFTQFARLHQVKVEGHGLGLSIVQRIIAKLGGEVGVESVVGQGSRFWFTLPCTFSEGTGGLFPEPCHGARL
ncbi:MAG: HAMP domain-containing histidine kinase [Anaerolineae bacterium]|nr:HAMP domain-containing histidine kinase [Anaerolineae bacterium]